VSDEEEIMKSRCSSSAELGVCVCVFSSAELGVCSPHDEMLTRVIVSREFNMWSNARTGRCWRRASAHAHCICQTSRSTIPPSARTRVKW